MRSPYTVLGVGKTAETEDIKSAYRQLAKTWHPDQKPDDPQAGVRFAEIAQAYKLLIDPDLRLQFDEGHIDARGRRRKRPVRGFSANPFSSFKRARPAEPGPQAKTGAAGTQAKGPDVETEAAEGASFHDMVAHIFGETAAKQARETVYSGKPGDNRAKTDAPGLDEDPLNALDALFEKWKTLHKPESDMPVSHHQIEITLETALIGYRGEIPFGSATSVSFNSPPGTLDGMELRVPSPDPTLHGDAIVTFRHAKHARLRAEGADLHGDHPINLAEAVLGGAFVFMALDGPVRMAIPEWSGSDTVLRIPGLGLPAASGARGDLHVHLRVMLPEKPDPKLIELMRSSKRSWFM